jgi:hypothetical protein
MLAPSNTPTLAIRPLRNSLAISAVEITPNPSARERTRELRRLGGLG